MNVRDWVPIVTAVVAVYGALLSTYNMITARRDRGRGVRVSLKWGLTAPGPEPVTVFILEATHPHGRPTTLTSCGIFLPDGRTLIIPRPFGSVQLPHELREGQGCSIFFPVRDVVRALQEHGYSGPITIRAFFRDALGSEYKSTKFKGNVAEWERAG